VVCGGQASADLGWASPALGTASSDADVRCILIEADADPDDVDAAQRASDFDPWLVLVHRDPAQVYAGDFDIVISPTAPLSSWVDQLIQPRAHNNLALVELASLSLLSGASDQDTGERFAAALGVELCKLQLGGEVRTGQARDTFVTDETWPHERAIAQAQELGVPVILESGKWCYTLPLEPPFGHAMPRLVFLSDRARLLGPSELAALRALASRLAAEVRQRSRIDGLARELDIARQMPGTDTLLGIWNRPAFESLLEGQQAGISRGRPTPAVAVIDVVDLDAINNAYGHRGGDETLRAIAGKIKMSLRGYDIIGRIGGDELGVIFTGTSADVASQVLGRILGSVDDLRVAVPGGAELQVRVTAGLADFEGPNDSAVAAIERAHRAAREAQEQGQRVRLYEGPRRAPTGQPGQAARTLGGSYRLLHEISQGGMGVVYRGQDLALGRPVAVKMLRPDLLDDRELLDRFRVEASILAQLHHPNLVQIYAFGGDGEENYFVMELVEGESVEEALERFFREGGRFSLTRVGEVATQIASALDALHSRGIVHRDVKPANIILAPFTNRAVLVDVGVAWRHGDTGIVAGTPGFIAPEAMASQAFSPRSDVYALAATIYAMIAQSEAFPFDEDLVDLYQRQQTEPPLPLVDDDPRLGAVDQVLRRALSPDIDQRPASAGEFARELGAAIGKAHRIRTDTSPPAPIDDATVEEPEARQHRVRGVVFRALPRVIGLRPAENLRLELMNHKPALAAALDSCGSPLDWIDVREFEDLLDQAAAVGWQTESFARELARATVRISFRRFFPVSSATLDPVITLAAVDSIWKRYHTWGHLVATTLSPTKVVIRVEGELPGFRGAVAWLEGAIEQIVTLSGATEVFLHRHAGAKLAYDVQWTAQAAQSVGP